MQDDTGGTSVSLRGGQPGGTFGDRVEVFGFLVRNASGWGLEDGQTRKIDASDLVPRDVTPNEVAAGNHGNTLIRVEATLVDRFVIGGSDLICLLRSDEKWSRPGPPLHGRCPRWTRRLDP